MGERCGPTGQGATHISISEINEVDPAEQNNARGGVAERALSARSAQTATPAMILERRAADGAETSQVAIAATRFILRHSMPQSLLCPVACRAQALLPLNPQS